MRISDWSSDVCSSDLARDPRLEPANVRVVVLQRVVGEADAAAAIRFDQRGRGALAEAEFDQRRNLRGRARLAVLADRGIGRLYARLLGLQPRDLVGDLLARTEEHTSDIQSLLSISYAVLSLQKHKP